MKLCRNCKHKEWAWCCRPKVPHELDPVTGGLQEKLILCQLERNHTVYGCGMDAVYYQPTTLRKVVAWIKREEP